MISGTSAGEGKRRIRLGMVGGGPGAFIGAVHRLAARMDDHFDPAERTAIRQVLGRRFALDAASIVIVEGSVCAL